MRHVVLCGLLIIASFFNATPAQAAVDDVKHFVEGLGNSVLEQAKDASKSEDEKKAQLKDLFFQNVDVDWIGQFVLGRFWRTATPEQQKNYLQNYRNFIAKNYTSKLNGYSGETYKIGEIRDEGDGKYTVQLEIVRPNQANVETQYSVRENNGAYKITDIVVEGVSLITTQRSEFASVVSRKGLDFLIEQLAKKGS